MHYTGNMYSLGSFYIGFDFISQTKDQSHPVNSFVCLVSASYVLAFNPDNVDWPVGKFPLDEIAD